MRVVTAITLHSLAIGLCLVLGTVGWFVIGFGVMTDCTNNYSCTTTGCAPCVTTGRWINAGGIAQLVLAAVSVAALVFGLQARRATASALVGALVLGLSVVTVVGTTRLAQESYCAPGDDTLTAAGERNYCPE